MRPGIVKEFDILGDYGQGWEIVDCCETKRKANDSIKSYRENEPGIPFKIKVSHVKEY